MDKVDRDKLLKIVGSNLRRMRVKAGDNLPNAKKKLGLSEPSISNYELGKREMGIVDLIIFCKTYNVSYEEILDYEFKEENRKIDFDKFINGNKGGI